MKLSIKTFLFFLAVSALSVTACKDDEDEKSKTDLLTSASCWQQTKNETLDPTGSNTWEDEPIDACTKDDCVKFNADKTLSFDEGATKCDPGDPQSSTGTWTLSADERTLTFADSGSGLAFSGTITELTDSKLVLEIDILGFKTRITWQPK